MSSLPSLYQTGHGKSFRISMRNLVKKGSLVKALGLKVCRFSDACMTNFSTRAAGRRQRSAKARNRGRRIAVGAAGYGARGASSRWSNLRGAIGWTDRWRVVGGLWRVREEVRGLEIAGHGKDPFGLVWAHGEGQLLRLLEVVDLSCQILRLRVTRNRSFTPLMIRLRLPILRPASTKCS